MGGDSEVAGAATLSAYRAGVFAGLGVREPGKRPGCAHTASMTIGRPRGPAPKPDSQRRRAQKPVSYGLAEPVVAGQAAQQPRLGFTAHKLVTAMWKALSTSVEGQFFSAADWQRASLELYYLNGLLTGERPLTAPAWSIVQTGLSELLISPADKRRAGIALQKAAVDVDEVAADEIIGGYKQRLKSA